MVKIQEECAVCELNLREAKPMDPPHWIEETTRSGVIRYPICHRCWLSDIESLTEEKLQKHIRDTRFLLGLEMILTFVGRLFLLAIFGLIIGVPIYYLLTGSLPEWVR